MSLPATISTQGLFCLTGNLATAQTSETVINITANNGTLDLNGFKLGGQAAGSATNTVGIFSVANNVTIKNGIVRGFSTGIDLRGRGAVVEDLLVDQNTNIGILVAGQGAIVRRNQVVDTGGSTANLNVEALGIEVQGLGSLIEHNVVADLTATGTGNEFGILVGGAHSLVRENFITDTAKPTGGGTSRGIELLAASINVLHNTVSNINTCILYSGASGFFAGNTVTGCNTDYTSGSAGHGNNPEPVL